MSNPDLRQVPYAPLYFVSRDGDVYSSKWSERRGGELRKLKPNPAGWYGMVRPCLPGGKIVTKTVHRLVAIMFVPGQTPETNVVRHLDGNPRNNRADNLAWGTQLDNIHDKFRHGTIARGDRNGRRLHPERYPLGEDLPSSKLSNAQVVTIFRRLQSGERGTDLAREYGVLKTTISSIKRGRNWRHLTGLPKPDARPVTPRDVQEGRPL